mmetsp:Transcript_71952/g.142763  ORF Transcript_71952/g.142763 Transcript_71952/m.142763 type:complete len:754 (+) Transcript_71952:186-2447(+)
MSTRGDKQHGNPGQGAQSGQRAVPAPKHPKRPQLRADFLLNFQRPPAHQRPQGYAPPPRRSRPSGRHSQTVPFQKGRFVQSAFRLYVDELTEDVVEAAFNADSLLQWESVRQVDLPCEQKPKCPICLEVDAIVPKITRCGHVFCAPCIMRYFVTLREYNGKTWQRCPVCNEMVSPEELISVRFDVQEALRENDCVSFMLAHREGSSTVVRPSAPPPAVEVPVPSTFAETAPKDSLLRLPAEGDWGWRLSRLVRLLPGQAGRIEEEELEALQSFRMVAVADGESDLLPGVDAATALLQQRARSRSTEGAATATSDSAGLLLPPPAVPCEEDDGHPSRGEEQGEDAPAGVNREQSSGSMSSPTPSPAAQLITTSPGGGGSMLASGRSTGGPRVSFYQVADGRPVYFEPFFTKILVHEHDGRWDGLPTNLDGLRVERLRDVTVTEELRKRHRHLSHLRLGSPITFAEVDLRPHLSKETKEHFAEEFAWRRQQRKKDQQRSQKQERLSKNRAAEEEERYYNSLNLPQPGTVPMQHVPTKEDFAVPLGAETAPEPPEGADEAASGGEAAGEGSADEADSGPTLAQRIRSGATSKAGQPKPKRRAADAAPPAPSPGDGSTFPSLGGGRPSNVVTDTEASSSRRPAGSAASSWGRGRGSDRAVGVSGKKAPSTESTVPTSIVHPIPDSWDDEVEPAETELQAPSGPADEPTFGEALEAALQRSVTVSAEAVGPEDTAGAAATGGKKKKGKAKATTIRLFG